MDIREQSVFYDDYWKGLTKMNSLKLERACVILKYFLILKKWKELPNVVELGCGDGRLISFIGFFCNAVGVELSDRAVERAKKMFPHVTYISGDVFKAELTKETYNAVISTEVIEHIEAQNEYLALCHTLLTKGGYLILTTPNKYVMERKKGGNWSNQPIEKLVSKKDLKDMVKEHFKLIKHTTIISGHGDLGILKFVKYFYKGMRKLGLIRTADFLICKLGFGLHQVILARKID